MVVAAAALSAGLAAGLVAPGVNIRISAPGLDLVLETLATLVAISVAVLGWVRYRQLAAPLALFEAAAFLVLATSDGQYVASILSGLDASAGLPLGELGQANLYVFTASRLMAAILLVVGGFASLRGLRPGRPWLVVVAPAVALVVIAYVAAHAGSLPQLASKAGPGSVQSSTLLGAALQVSVAALLLWAAALSRRLYRRYGSLGHAWLALGLVFGAFAQAYVAVSPHTETGLVTTANFLWLVFDLCLFVGVETEVGVALAGLRTANLDLRRLRALDAERATLEERAHLARELHDGLAQNLWLAKLKAGRLAGLAGFGPDAAALVGELGDAIDAGLAEAQQAVTALRIAGQPAGPFWDVIARYVDDFADRFGLRAEIDCPNGASGLTARAEAELVRIAQEALSNVRRHADATFVRVHAAIENGHLELTVGDNGRGFDPEQLGEDAYGLSSMRERAAIIGAELRIDSHPHDGTRIRVLLPVPHAAPAPGASG